MLSNNTNYLIGIILMQNIKIDGRKVYQSFTNDQGVKILVIKQDKGVFFTDCKTDSSYNTGDTTKQAVETMVNKFMNGEQEVAAEPVAAPAIDMTAPVAIYKNLHNGLFSVKQRGLVVAHVASVTLTSVTLKVSEAGRQRVLRDKQKNVHAYVVGMIKDINKPCDNVGARLSYNPYKAGYFTWCDNGSKAIIGASEALYCDSSKGLFVQNKCK